MNQPSKSFNIDKRRVYEAYLQVRSNGGAAGVDGVTVEQFESKLEGKSLQDWNRMSSGAYLPPLVRAVSIPKMSGGQRMLRVPTVADRVAQTVVKQLIEPALDSIFMADAYIPADVDTFDPHPSTTAASAITFDQLYDSLLYFRRRRKSRAHQTVTLTL